MAERLPSGPVTIVFSDVVGSTDLRTEHGDVAAHRLLRAHEDIVRRCVAAHEGREVKALGDGFMLAFVSVRQALGCAVAIQQASAERNAESPGEEVHVRIGVNTGEVVVENGDLYGQAVNASARIAAAARAGEILVSEIVRQLAGSGSGFAFVDRGEVGLKGFPEPWRLYGVAHQATRPAAGGALGGRTPFVGRQAERVELRRVLAQVQSGTGAFVMIGGEPGVGKTRLAEELARRCEREGFLIYTGHCYEAAGAAPYIPIVEAYEQALARAPSPAAFRAFLGESAPDVARLVPRLRALCPDIPPPVELPAEQERRYLFNSLWDVLERTARTKPTLLVLDDIHWADEPTMLLLQHIAERVAGVRLLVVGLYRDTELDAGRPLSAVFGELTRRRLATRLPLKRLSSDSVREMLTALSGVEPPESLVELFYAETEGNPFFTEEVFKHLAEEGRLFDGDGQFRSDLQVDGLDVPEGVRLVVGARLQRLGEDAVKVLAGAAVIGRVFALEVLRQLEETAEEPLLDRLERAERAGLIVAVPAAGAAADEQYMFAHELIRQSVLANLSAARRRRLHSRVADVLEHHHAAALEPHAAAIAQHLLDAGPAADPKRAFRFLLLAGTWAQATAAFEEATAHLEAAYERVDAAGPVERAELLHRLGTAHQALAHWDEAIEAWRQAVARLRGHRGRGTGGAHLRRGRSRTDLGFAVLRRPRLRATRPGPDRRRAHPVPEPCCSHCTAEPRHGCPACRSRSATTCSRRPWRSPRRSATRRCAGPAGSGWPQPHGVDAFARVRRPWAGGGRAAGCGRRPVERVRGARLGGRGPGGRRPILGDSRGRRPRGTVGCSGRQPQRRDAVSPGARPDGRVRGRRERGGHGVARSG